MNVRSNDEAGVSIDRKVPLPWLVGIVTALIFNAGIVWNGLSTLAITVGEIKNQQIASMTADNAYRSAKDVKDAQQDLRQDDFVRRLTTIEDQRFGRLK